MFFTRENSLEILSEPSFFYGEMSEIRELFYDGKFLITKLSMSWRDFKMSIIVIYVEILCLSSCSRKFGLIALLLKFIAVKVMCSVFKRDDRRWRQREDSISTLAGNMASSDWQMLLVGDFRERDEPPQDTSAL
jgi:hypothetical protein